MRLFFITIIFSMSYVFAQNNNAKIQSLLKERTTMDFKVISNDVAPLNGASFVVVESPSGERLALLVSQDGSYIIPLADGITTINTQNALKIALDNVNGYNKNMKDKNVLALFQKHKNSVLRIPANAVTQKTTYMILDTTCPYCLQEILRLEEYLNKGNLEVLIVGILGQKAYNRAAGYYSEFPHAKTKEQKISLLKKIFEINYTPKNLNEKLAKEITEDIIAAGVQGVPYLIIK